MRRGWKCLVLGVLKVSRAYTICRVGSGDEGERRKNDLPWLGWEDLGGRWGGGFGCGELGAPVGPQRELWRWWEAEVCSSEPGVGEDRRLGS